MVRAETYDALDQAWRRHRHQLLERFGPEVTEFAKAAVAFDHADWHGVFGNALTIELERGEGPLAQMLDAMLQSLQPSRRSPPRRDGLTIVHDAAAHGQLLGLARAIVEANTVHGGGHAHGRALPQDVYDVARSLLAWHDTILRNLPGTFTSGAAGELA